MPSKLQVVKLLELPCSYGSVSPSLAVVCAALRQDSPTTARPALKTLLTPRPSHSNSGLLLSPIGLWRLFWLLARPSSVCVYPGLSTTKTLRRCWSKCSCVFVISKTALFLVRIRKIKLILTRRSKKKSQKNLVKWLGLIRICCCHVNQSILDKHKASSDNVIHMWFSSLNNSPNCTCYLLFSVAECKLK